MEPGWYYQASEGCGYYEQPLQAEYFMPETNAAELSDGRLVLDQIVPGETIQAPVYVIL